MTTRQFTKWHGDTLDSDWQRLKVLEQICSHVDNVVTIKSRYIDADSQSIIYDYYDFPEPIINRADDACVWTHLGQALARMQRVAFDINGDGFNTTPYPLDAFALNSADRAALADHFPVSWFHGDFAHGNVFFTPSSDILVVDPLPARGLFQQHYLYACAALDVASMYRSLLLSHPLKRQLLFNTRRYIHAADTFLNAYMSEAAIVSERAFVAVRHLSQCIGLQFINGYKTRLSWPVAAIKKRLALNIMARVDEDVGWSK